MNVLVNLNFSVNLLVTRAPLDHGFVVLIMIALLAIIIPGMKAP